jgi:hypothetical protein
MEDCEIWLNGANQGSSFSHIAVAGGEVDADNSYYMVGDGLQTSGSVVINPYTDINGDDALLYWSRNGNPEKLLYTDNQFTATALLLQGRANTNGMFPLVWDGKEFFIYSTKDGTTHYLDGFAIAESGGEPIIDIPKTTTTNNGFQSQWLNAEVDEDGVTIYQYYPGNNAGHFTVWRLTKDTPAMMGDVNDDGLVNITDVTLLINAVLNDNYDNINRVNANMNGDDAINITDVTMLITNVLAN